jgi:hypothetical protein
VGQWICACLKAGRARASLLRDWLWGASSVSGHVSPVASPHDGQEDDFLSDV